MVGYVESCFSGRVALRFFRERRATFVVGFVVATSRADDDVDAGTSGADDDVDIDGVDAGTSGADDDVDDAVTDDHRADEGSRARECAAGLSCAVALGGA
jgi:hypothetical protein